MDTKSTEHGVQVERGMRFEFGANWARFLERIDERRIEAAVQSLRDGLQVSTLEDMRFVDVGSGSGLFSLAARRLGAVVHSFDFDPHSVACTCELRRRYFADDSQWTVDEASVLDKDYLAKLTPFDVVYCWGVLHHTGSMWEALGNVSHLVASTGQLFLAIYNDQGRASRHWTRIKKMYCSVPEPVKTLIVLACFVRLWGPALLRDLLRGWPGETWRKYETSEARGMSPWRDVVDWVGGYPFEVARPEGIFNFYKIRGFRLVHLKTCGGGLGCNEFVFTR